MKNDNGIIIIHNQSETERGREKNRIVWKAFKNPRNNQQQFSFRQKLIISINVFVVFSFLGGVKDKERKREIRTN